MRIKDKSRHLSGGHLEIRPSHRGGFVFTIDGPGTATAIVRINVGDAVQMVKFFEAVGAAEKIEVE